MEKVDLDYCKMLFKKVEHYEITYPYYGFRDNKFPFDFDFAKVLPSFLEMVISYANAKDIPEVHKTGRSYDDDRFCYWIRLKNKVIEIGMYYDDTVYAIDQPEDVTPEYVMDCDDIIKFDKNENKKILFKDFKIIKTTKNV